MARVFFEITGNRGRLQHMRHGMVGRGEKDRVGIKHHASGSKDDRFLLPKACQRGTGAD
ncbi:hypothetical protein HCBG_03020 [Histoplasma capsulatum G186AR]|uniref:Uncharacterized protein n=1 Tax=Ajellomyces capsulatus (strain G186AR / H82 / ATCC MYA-2454 / RMSCC 2432) TaxID=447093 RepID=C0NI48_AJECG|nr:uncharacterized protein HCBG_03020 [Histoplasma capsulatum G186AR]EEH09483.1 hypothetical protein HCBG_03020 [Histoplasma capsulatum G186AR]